MRSKMLTYDSRVYSELIKQADVDEISSGDLLLNMLIKVTQGFALVREQGLCRYDIAMNSTQNMNQQDTEGDIGTKCRIKLLLRQVALSCDTDSNVEGRAITGRIRVSVAAWTFCPVVVSLCNMIIYSVTNPKLAP